MWSKVVDWSDRQETRFLAFTRSPLKPTGARPHPLQESSSATRTAYTQLGHFRLGSSLPRPGTSSSEAVALRALESNRCHTVGVLNLSVGVLNLSVGVLNLSVGVLNLSVGVLNLSVGVLNLSIGVLNLSVGVLNLSVGVLNLSVGVLNLSVGVLNLSVGVLNGCGLAPVGNRSP